LHLRQVALLVQVASLLAHTDEGAHRVEEVSQHDGHHGEHAQASEHGEADVAKGAEVRSAATSSGRRATPGVGKTVYSCSRLRITATTVAAIIPHSSASRTPRAMCTKLTTSPMTATYTGTPVRLPIVTGTVSPRRTMPALTRPMNRINQPIPTAIACLSTRGYSVEH